jgi:hypothetical protein
MSYVRSISPANFGPSQDLDGQNVDVKKKKAERSKKKTKKKKRKGKRKGGKVVEYDENGHKMMVKNVRKTKIAAVTPAVAISKPTSKPLKEIKSLDVHVTANILGLGSAGKDRIMAEKRR